MTCFLEGQVVICLQLLEVGRNCRRRREGGCGAVRIGRIGTGAAFGAAVHKHCLVNNDLGRIAALALLILPGAGLDRAGDAKGRALLEELGNELSGLTPSNKGDEISLLSLCLIGGTRLESAIYGKRKGGNVNAALGLLEFEAVAKTTEEAPATEESTEAAE